MIPVNHDAQISAEDIRALENELQEHNILTKNGDDTLRWGYSQKENFSIKEAYNIKIRGQQEEDEIWKKVWNSNPWPKVATLCWLVVRRRILMGENLSHKGIQGPSRCVLCVN